ncbi:MAG: hydroxyacid dehydrogenase [Rhodospirillales bacterium]|nr:hydroxyacid dehydrogenase [Rhodospirillales bacterium]
MAEHVNNLVYFENWMRPVAEEILGAQKGINLQCLSFADDADANWSALESAHGYQLLASTEMKAPFIPKKELIERCPNLLAFSVTGAGYDMIDVDACTKAGIMVVNQAGANSESVAQHVLGLMLVLSKQIVQGDRRMRRQGNDWDRWGYQGKELTGRTLGIIGLGNVGRRVAALAGQMFAMRVIACDPYIESEDFKERGALAVSMDEVFQQADFVSVNCPLTEETKGMIGAREFGLMKEQAFFITTARGGIHDEAALVEVLAGGGIAGAGLDVFEQEPPPFDHPVFEFENVIVSPHVAGITDDCLHNMSEYAASQWLTIFKGARPPRLINTEVWPKYRERYESIFGVPPEE